MTRIFGFMLAGLLAGTSFGMDGSNKRKRGLDDDDAGVRKKLSKLEMEENSDDEKGLDDDEETKGEMNRDSKGFTEKIVTFKTTSGSTIELSYDMLMMEPNYGFFHSLALANPDKPILLPMTDWVANYLLDYYATGAVHLEGLEDYRINYLREYARKYGVMDVYEEASFKLDKFTGLLEKVRIKARKHGIKEPLFEGKYGELLPLLFYGILEDKVAFVKCALKMGASLEDEFTICGDHHTAFSFAALEKSLQVLKYLIEVHDMDVDAAVIKHGKNNFKPILHKALLDADLELARFAISLGADVNLEHDDDTPLTLACREGFPEIVKLLLENHANASQEVGPRRQTAYMVCSSSPLVVDCLRTLLQLAPLQATDPAVGIARREALNIDDPSHVLLINSIWEEFYPHAEDEEDLMIMDETKSNKNVIEL